LVLYADRFPLQGPIWKLVSLGEIENQRPPIDNTDFTATFVRDLTMPSGHMSGTTGCNDYISIYYSNLSEIKVNLPQTSQNTCSDAVTEEEQAFFLGLNSARVYRILGNELEIYYDGMMLKFVGTFPPSEGTAGPLIPLDGTKWWLTSIDTVQAVPGVETTAQFSINPNGTTGQINGSTGCNTYNTEITSVFTVGLASATQLLCDTRAGIMEQESAYLTALETASNFSLEGDMLKIITNQGVLNFTNIGPKPEQPLPTPGPTNTPSAVQPLPITAVISASAEGQVNETIVFDGSGSISDAEITSYAWNFGDETVGEGLTIEHVFANSGVYTVTLTITDANGQTASASLEVTIT
jgi:heat shock protein HslJ